VKDAVKAKLHEAPAFTRGTARAEDAGRVAAADLEEVIFKETAGGLVGPFEEIFGASELGKLAAETVTDGLKSLFAKTFKLGETICFLTFLRTGSAEQANASARAALERMISPDFRSRFEQERPKPRPDFAEKLRAADPVPPESPWAKDAEGLLEKLPEEARRGNERNFANLVSDYETEFPRGKRAFARDQLLQFWGVKDSNDVEQRVARASDFERLQSYSRVGGILFGREPQTKTTVPFSSLTWTVGTDGYRITLRGASMIELGPFPPYLVNQALSYAADGRATVLTMMNGETIGRKQVIMHPAFQNTALGCRLVAADEWIFNYTDSGASPKPSGVRRTLNQAGAAVELYKEAIKLIRDPSSSRLAPGLPQSLAEDIRAGSAMLLPAAQGLGLDANLLRTISTCAEQHAARWTECVSEGANAWKNALPERPPITGFVSQIREQPYSVGPQLAGFLVPPAASDPLWPLQFTVQLTVNDTARWEFPDFARRGPAMVLEGIEHDGKVKHLQEVRELCLLQRAFRAALSGGFGGGFPLEALIALQAETARSVPKGETPRWLAEQGDAKPLYVRELRQELASYLAQADRLKQQTVATQEAKTKLQACQAVLRAPTGAAEAAKACAFNFEDKMKEACLGEWDRISEDEFQKLASCRLFGIARLGTIASAVYRLRESLQAGAVLAKGSALECARQTPPVALTPFARLR
jgi:hypothetical protein